MNSPDTIFETAIKQRDDGDLKEAAKTLQNLIRQFPNVENRFIVHSVLGGIYSDLGDKTKALENFTTATNLNPKSELASLGLYVTLAEMEQYEKAIKELFRFLKEFPANLYLDTLQELLEGLENGYMTIYKSEIIELARVNGISPSLT